MERRASPHLIRRGPVAAVEGDEEAGLHDGVRLGEGAGSRRSGKPLRGVPGSTAVMGDTPKPTVFISYAKADTAWKDLLVEHLGVLGKQGLLDIWDDSQIESGDEWKRAIEQAIERAKVAVLIISVAYLNSDFILGEEVSRLLQRRKKDGLRIIPILVRPCDWEDVKWLSLILPSSTEALSAKTSHDVEQHLAKLVKQIRRILTVEIARSNPRVLQSYLWFLTADVIVVYLSGGSILMLVVAWGLTAIMLSLLWTALLYLAVTKGFLSGAAGLGSAAGSSKAAGAGAVGYGAAKTFAGGGLILALTGGTSLGSAELAATVLAESDHKPSNRLREMPVSQPDSLVATTSPPTPTTSTPHVEDAGGAAPPSSDSGAPGEPPAEPIASGVQQVTTTTAKPQPAGGACLSDDNCITRRCVGAVCLCKQNGQACGEDAECCSGSECRNQICMQCSRQFEYCASEAECCGSLHCTGFNNCYKCNQKGQACFKQIGVL